MLLLQAQLSYLRLQYIFYACFFFYNFVFFPVKATVGMSPFGFGLVEKPIER